MADEQSRAGTERSSDRLRSWSDPVVGMFARHWTIFILPLLMFTAGLFVLYLGSINCKDTLATCIASTDKSYVATCIGFIAASVGLSSWLASFYQEFDRQRFELFNNLHKEFRTTEQFRATFMAIEEAEKLFVRKEALTGKQQTLTTEEDPFTRIDDGEAVSFAAFFEIVAISVQSNLISADIANYFFGNYLIIALSSQQFKSKIGYDEEPFRLYWSLLRRFEEIMINERGKMTGKRFASTLRI